MQVWTFGTVESEPQVRLSEWRVLEAGYVDRETPRSRHFVGCDSRDGTGRVSSAITSLDVLKRRGSTRRGRIYELVGRSGSSSNAEYVWDMFCRINGVTSTTDVSQELLDGPPQIAPPPCRVTRREA
jgi:hypothetical protein